MSIDSGSIIGCILAGGLSRRMGSSDKALMHLGSLPMIQHVADRLRPQVAELVINANSDLDSYRVFGLPVVKDTIEGHAGPLAGIATGMNWARINNVEATHLATAAADTPFFPADLVARLLERTSGREIVIASSRSKHHPVFGIWPLALHDDLATWMSTTETFKVMTWVKRHPWATVEFHDIDAHPNGIDPFFNANTPDELAAAESFFRTMTAGTGDVP